MKPLPDDACSFWHRAQMREIDMHGFGFTPSFSEAQAEAIHDAEEREDEKDPPCGLCVCCLEAVAEDGPPE